MCVIFQHNNVLLLTLLHLLFVPFPALNLSVEENNSTRDNPEKQLCGLSLTTSQVKKQRFGTCREYGVHEI